MKKIIFMLFGFCLFIQSASALADSICHTTRVKIKNDSSFDCVLTDFIHNKITDFSPVIFKNQSTQFDLPSNQKILIQRYQCGQEASFLLYFFEKYESNTRGYYSYEKLKIKAKNIKVKDSRKDSRCNVLTAGSPAQWFITIED